MPRGSGSSPSAGDAGHPTDEEAARRARTAYSRRGIPAIEPDAAVAPMIGAEERVLGMRAQAQLGRVDARAGGIDLDGGTLYVTSQRLIHLGSRLTSIRLADIREMAMADRRLLVTLADAGGVTVDADEPHQLRVLVAAARSALLSAARVG